MEGAAAFISAADSVQFQCKGKLEGKSNGLVCRRPQFHDCGLHLFYVEKDGGCRLRTIGGMQRSFFASLLALALIAAVPKGSGAKMCVLTPADFAAAGIAGTTKPSVNVDDGGNSAYCVYRGKSGAMGGVELDVFYPAGAAATDVEQTFKTVLASDPGARYDPESIPGSSESVYSLRVPQSGHPDFAANAVRRGDLVFSISLPASAKAKAQLEGLSKLVLQRL
jgi:hypothetical protein